MNGITTRRLNGYDGGRSQLLRPLGAPKGPQLVEGYRPDAMNNFQPEKPRFNPMNPGRTQSSILVDLKDQVQVHLLTETALFDSKEYEILSQEEVDDLKKQVLFIGQRIEQTRSDLAIQSKYRDAAISMSKLYSPSAGPKRKSLLGNRNGGSDAAREAEAERLAIQKKCEELASELWTLERRVMEPQRRLLEHTAGILQLTHRTAKKVSTPKKSPLPNGVPASPESMYTASNGRDSFEPDELLFFDEGSLYRSFDDAERFGVSRSKNDNPEIPVKSPVREQHKQLTVESERLREENIVLKQQTDSLRSQTQSLNLQLEDLKTQSTDQWRSIADTERKLEVFNKQLRQVIVSADPVRNGEYRAPPSGQLEPGDMIGSHLDYLEKAVLAIGGSQGQSNNVEASKAVQALNLQIQDVLLLNGSPSHPPPPDFDAEFDVQIDYMQESLRAVDAALQRAAELSSTGSADKQRGEQAEAVLMGLWDIIQSGYADIKQRSQDRRRTRLEKGLEPEDDEASDTESFDPDEKYSLSAFSTKVQWLYAQATKLKEQKAVLKRQIKQQRELNSKSDGEKDEALNTKVAELEETRARLDHMETELDDVRGQLSTVLADLEDAQNNAQQSGQEQSVAIKEAQDQLQERNTKIASLEASTRDVQSRLSAAEANIATITAQLQEVNDAKSEVDEEIEEKNKEVKRKQDELDQMTGMMAEYKLEATLAKAELDGAYGTRRERAAEVAALHNTSETAKLQAKVGQLQPRIDELEKELRGTVQDLKDITKQSIDAESKIADLESELDKVTQTARMEKEKLQDTLDHERLKASSGPLSPSGRPNASILTDSYRDALRAERKKYEEQLRSEQMNRRKLEDELRALKRAAGPGKSLLSPR
ncbi:Up-regulated during septation-domain-containing protein [Xylariales sp. AK1849]|nr:Up-regulated during septation-domain-containing protein [Xylariales sp. AK1849]